MATNNACNYAPTQYATQVGGASGTLASVGPGTAGQILLSGGASANPSYVTPAVGTGLSVTTNASTLSYALSTPVSIANGGTNAASMSTSTGIVKYDGSSLVTSSALKLDSSNRMTNSAQPCFFAYLNASVSNVTGDGTAYTVIPNTVTFDQNSNYNSSTGVFTAPVAGRYLFKAGVYLLNLTSSYNQYIIKMTSTGASYVDYQLSPGPIRDSVNGLGGGNSIIANMAANDTISFSVQVSGSTKTVGVFGGAVRYTFFSGCLLC